MWQEIFKVLVTNIPAGKKTKQITNVMSIMKGEILKWYVSIKRKRINLIKWTNKSLPEKVT